MCVVYLIKRKLTKVLHIQELTVRNVVLLSYIHKKKTNVLIAIKLAVLSIKKWCNITPSVYQFEKSYIHHIK